MSQSIAQIKRVDIFISPGLMSVRSGADFINEGNDPKLAIGGGVGASFALTEKLSLNGSLLYERKGAKGDIVFRDVNGPAGEGTVYMRLNSISIPLTVGYDFGEKIRMQLGAGFFVGTLITTKQVYKGTGQFDDEEEEMDMKTLDYGVTFAYTIYIPVSAKYDIRLGVQDNLGLADLSKGSWSFKTNALNVIVGTSFKF